MINEFVEKLIDRLEGLKKSESDREDYSDNHDYYDDWEYAFGDGASYGRHYAYGRSIKIIEELAGEYKDVPDTNVGKNLSESLIEKIKFGIEASNINDDYTTGLRNGMRYCLSLIDGKEPKFESCKQGWIPVSEALPDDFMSYEYLTIRKGQTLATITYYCVVNHKWYSNRKSTKEIDVIAWQPLPQLCKGE